MQTEWVPKAGDSVFVFVPRTKRCRKRKVERVQHKEFTIGKKSDYVHLCAKPGERDMYPVDQVSRTKEEAERNYYQHAVKRRDHWQKYVDFFEKKSKKQRDLFDG